MHISGKSSLYFVVTARSNFIIFLLLLLFGKALCDYIVFLCVFSCHITTLEAGFI